MLKIMPDAISWKKRSSIGLQELWRIHILIVRVDLQGKEIDQRKLISQVKK